MEVQENKDTGKKVYEELFKQSQVAYQVQSPNTGQVCANCRWYKSDSWKPCYIVENDAPLPIVSGGYCDQWSMRPSADILLPEIQTALANGNIAVEVEIEPMMIGEMSAKSLITQMWQTKSIAPLADYVNRALGTKQLPSAFTESGFKSLNDKQWIAWYTNNFQDREKEWFTEKSIDRFCKAANDGLLAMPELWYYHVKGTSVGKALKLFHVGHFLIALGEWDNKADNAKVAHVQKWAKNADIRLSHGFLYNPAKKINGVYHDFATFEITLLDNGLEANPYTPFHSVKINEVNKIMAEVTQTQKDALYKVFPKELADDIISGASEGGKALEAAGVAYKASQDDELNPDTSLILAVMGKMNNRFEVLEKAISDMVGDGEGDNPKKKKPKADSEDKAFNDAVALLHSFDSDIQTIATNVRSLKTEFDKFRRGGTRGSKSDETLISDDDKQANHIHQKNYEQGLGTNMGLIQQMAMKGMASLSDAIPFDDDMPKVPNGKHS